MGNKKSVSNVPVSCSIRRELPKLNNICPKKLNANSPQNMYVARLALLKEEPLETLFGLINNFATIVKIAIIANIMKKDDIKAIGYLI